MAPFVRLWTVFFGIENEMHYKKPKSPFAMIFSTGPIQALAQVSLVRSAWDMIVGSVCYHHCRYNLSYKLAKVKWFFENFGSSPVAVGQRY
jgi:hypothetical protein